MHNIIHLCNALKSVYLNRCRYLSVLLKYPGCSASMTSLFLGRICVSGSHLNPDRPGVYKAMKPQMDPQIRLCFRLKEGHRRPPFCGVKAGQVQGHPAGTGRGTGVSAWIWFISSLKESCVTPYLELFSLLR